MKILIQILLWGVILFLSWKLFDAIYGEVQFNKLKEERYKAAITKLRDIRVAELAHKQVVGKYEGDFNKLIRFLDTAEFTITQRRDTTVLDVVETQAYGVDTYKEIVLIDTLGFESVKDSLFKGSDRYKTMMNIPIDGVTDKYELEAGFIEKNNAQIPVFEAKVAKEVLLFDQKRDYIIKEKQIVSVDQVNGEYLSVGSMEQINTNGNWPKSYGANDQ